MASDGYNFVRRFAAAAAPFLAPKIAEWTDVQVPFVVAGAAAVCGAAIVRARRSAPPPRRPGAVPVHTSGDGVAVFAD